MDIINRVGKYRKGAWYTRDVKTITKITVHHTAIPLKNYEDDEKLLKYLQQIHEGHGWPGLAYHFVITKSGKVYQINEFSEVTWHDTKNWDSIGVCLNGYFHPDVNDKPTKEQLKSLDALLDKLCTQHPEFPADQNDVVGHRERSATACPGNNLFPYVVEYRSKAGNVGWGAEETQSSMETPETEGNAAKEQIKALEKELQAMRESRDKWKKEYEEERNKNTKEVKDMQEHIESLQKTISEHGQQTAGYMVTISNLEESNKILAEEVLGCQRRLDVSNMALETAVNENGRLTIKLKECKDGVEKSIIARLIEFLKGGAI